MCWIALLMLYELYHLIFLEVSWWIFWLMIESSKPLKIWIYMDVLSILSVGSIHLLYFIRHFTFDDGSMNLLTILLNAARYFIVHFFDFFWGKYYFISWFYGKLIFTSFHPFKSLYPFWIFFDILNWTSFSCANVCYHVCRIYIIPFFNFSKSSFFDDSVSHPFLERSVIIIDPMQDNLAACKREWLFVMVVESSFNNFSSVGVTNSSK